MTEPIADDDQDSDDAFLREVAHAPAITPRQVSQSLVGVRLAHFLVRAKLGSGGMGVVYEAEDEKLGRTVALKVLPPVGDAESRRRFVREARAASRIVHPNVATVYEAGEAEAGAYIAMEYVRGETLRAWLRSPRSIDARVRVAREIARALSMAHEAGIVHRDLKPDNVMITPDGSAKVLDFGLAKQHGVVAPNIDETATVDGRILGTPSYMSPEQAKGKAVDARSDVFSFGILLYETFTGERPFKGETTAEILIAIDRDEPVAPTKRAAEVPADVERLIVRCLAKRPDDRFPNGGAVLGAIDAIVPTASAPRRWTRSPWLRVAIGVAVLAEISVLFAAYRSHDLRRAPLTPPSARMATEQATGKAMTDFAPYGSKNEGALEAYRHGLQYERDALTGGCDQFMAATAIDPAFAEAHLRRALCIVDSGDIAFARKAFREAMTRRTALHDRDRALADAFEPMMDRNPADAHTASERMAAASARFPDDAEIAYYHALAVERDAPADAQPLYDRALALDPKFARAWYRSADRLYATARFDEGDRAVDRCLALAPDSALCLWLRGTVNMQRGACAEVESDARRTLTVAPYSFFARCALASALVDQGRPVAAARELIEQSVPLDADGGTRAMNERLDVLQSRSQADILVGDFAASLGRFREMEPLVAPLTDEGAHAGLALYETISLIEMGREGDGIRTARDFLARHDAWEPNPGTDAAAIRDDHTAIVAGFVRRAGQMSKSDFDAVRAMHVDRWMKRVRSDEARGFIWVVLYAAATETAEDAKEALAALPGFGRPPPWVVEYPVDAIVGHAYLLAGRVDDALPLLERATRACDSMTAAYVHTRAFYDLGQAREAKGDPAGACAAYGQLLARWGGAKPRSLTAERALARSRVIRCAR